MPRNKLNDAALRELRAFGLAYPGAHTKSPWPGHLDLAVNDKTFAYLSLEGEPFSISCKLPRSSMAALMLPFCKPTPYGLGKSGWVSASFADTAAPVEMLKEWIDESYRAQAPKRLLKGLATSAPSDTSAPKRSAAASAAKSAGGATKKRPKATAKKKAAAQTARPKRKAAARRAK